MDGDGSSYYPLVGSMAIAGTALLILLLNTMADASLNILNRGRGRVEAVVVSALAITDILVLAVLITAMVTLLQQRIGDGLLGAMILVGLVVLGLRAIAAAVGSRGAVQFAPLLAVYLNLLALLTRPIQWVLGRLAAPFRSVEVISEAGLSEEELRVLATVAGDPRGEAQIEEEEREMIAGVVTLGQTTARELMVPRIDIIALDIHTPMLTALDTIINVGHSRIPVYAESVDAIQGILYAKDLLAYLRDGRTDVPIRDILRPAFFVPESKKADEVLASLRQSHVHIAIVMDEYGGTAGLLTIEDVLEEIVGEIQDEYDVEEPFIEVISPYEAICNARVDLDDLNWTMDLALPTEESDTLGGLIYAEMGGVPLVGDKVPMIEQAVTFEVLAVAGRRITKVRVIKHQPPRDQGEPGDAEDELASSTANEDAIEDTSREQSHSRLFNFARLFSE